MYKGVMLAAFAVFFTAFMSLSGAQTTAYCQPSGFAGTQAPDWYCSQINQAVASVWTEWEPVALITISLAFLVAATIFIVGIAMRNDTVRKFGIGELYEAAATALIAIAFLTLSAVMFGIIPSLTTGPINPYTTSLTYISSTMVATQGVIKSLYGVIMIDEFYNSIDLDIYVGEGGGAVSSAIKTGKSVVDFIKPLAQTLMLFFLVPAETISGLLIDGLLALSAEFYLILFFMYIAIPVFLIPGIIFRAIFPLRSMGGMLIAIAISFYLIMPLLFSIAYYFTNQSLIASLNAASATITANGQGTLAQSNAASQTAPLVTAVKGLQSSMGAYFLSVLFYPALILALTYTSMRVIAEFIGGVAQMSRRMSLL